MTVVIDLAVVQGIGLLLGPDGNLIPGVYYQKFVCNCCFCP